jgi:beta-RFAP synthase
MDEVVVRTGSRLHFGLLGWGVAGVRAFGGLGMMVDAPELRVVARLADAWSAQGPLAERALAVARRFESAGPDLPLLPPVRLTIEAAPPHHAGLGVGTQLALAVATALHALAGRPSPGPVALARLSGRGLRSGVGLHGFAQGGLIVDGGHGEGDAPPPLVARVEVPGGWNVLLATPSLPPGRHGPDERAAFAGLPPAPVSATDRLCRRVLLGVLPAAVEGELSAFGTELEGIQDEVGTLFAPAQAGGRFAHPMLHALAEGLRALGLHGVGQSSWGPTLYGFTDRATGGFDAGLDALCDRLGLDRRVFHWTRARNAPAELTPR